MLASLKREYGIDLRNHDYTARQLADLTVNLPQGCAFWVSFGGPLAWSQETHALVALDFRVQVLAWMQSEDGQKKRNQPEPTKPPVYAYERDRDERRVESRAAAWRRRQIEQTTQ